MKSAGSWCLILLTFVLVFASQVKSKQIKCSGIKLDRLGCYADNQKSGNRPLPLLVLTYRDKSSKQYAGEIVWTKYGTFMETIICKCAEKVLKHGYSVMGLQNYGECWSGSRDKSYSNDGPGRDCINWKYERCRDGMDCIGEDNTNFVYRVQRDLPSPTAKPTEHRSTTPRTTTPTPSQTPSPSPTPSPTPPPSPSTTPYPTTSGTWPTTRGMSSPKPSGFGTSTAKRPPSPTKFPIPCYSPSNEPCSTPIMPCASPCQPLVDPALLMRYQGPSALGFPTPMGQYQQQPLPCGSTCSAQCAPKCRVGCCRTFGGLASVVQFPIGYSNQNRLPTLAKPGCKYGCPSKCAPRCTARCCRSAIKSQAFQNQFLMNYALGFPQTGLQSSLRAQGQCNQGCSSKCVPRCNIECCSTFQQPFPVQPQMPTFSPVNYQAQLVQRNICRQGCPAMCSPRCLPGCCRWSGGFYKRAAILKHKIPHLDDY